LAGGETATEKEYFKLDYTFYLNFVAFALSGFLYFVYRRGLGAPFQYRDPVCGMRTDEDSPSVEYEDETYYFCSNRCKDKFDKNPSSFVEEIQRR
ncbi:MAG: YHS domain-containing protein, partial [Halobacteria archaeon]|nr:YHS domain-containing protein [Halobacteria archaeon]